MISKPNKDSKLPESYRPISLLNVIGKSYKKIVNTRLKKHLCKNNIISQTQLGFRSDCCAQQAVLKLQNHATFAINQKGCCLTIFLDLAQWSDVYYY